MDSPDPPDAPDPKETAAAQSQMNKETAIAQAGLNMVNQNTPYGSLTYNQIGQWSDKTPRYEAITQLTPEQQKIFDTNLVTQQNLADIGSSQSARIGDLLNTPFSLDTSQADKLSGMQKQFLDPQWGQQQEQLEASLLNRGIAPGTDAYDQAMQSFGTNKQRAYDQMYLDAYNTAANSALTERNQPINEISALLSGSQVTQPQFVNTPNTGVAPTDYTGIVNNNYAQQMSAYNQQQAQGNGMMSGLFGLGSAALGGWATGGFA